MRILLLLPLLVLALAAQAAPGAGSRAPQPYHPVIKLLDAQGKSVMNAGTPVSAARSCGYCHEIEDSAAHSFHANAGQDRLVAPGGFSGARPWDFGPGWYGRWNPMTYSLPLSNNGTPSLDSSAWLRELGFRYAGGGPMFQDGATQVELNCFLCHLAAPDNTARVKELAAGRFSWATTATLARTGAVSNTNAGWAYNPAIVAADGTVPAAALGISLPRSENCGLCHGAVYLAEQPLELQYGLGNWTTENTGQVMSAQRISASAMNLLHKDSLVRPWDIHAERMLSCNTCHFSKHKMTYTPLEDDTAGNKLPGRLDFHRGPFLQAWHSKDESIGAGQSAAVAQSGGGRRRCEECHDAEPTHERWLPYTKRHMLALSCEACHIPHIYAPARSLTDWTITTPAGGPSVEYRWGGTQGLMSAGEIASAATLLEDYQPVLMPRRDAWGKRQLVPVNLQASWYWIGDADAGSAIKAYPVSRETLHEAFFTADGYKPELLAAMDQDGDRQLSDAELRRDTPQKVQAAQQLLQAAGVRNPRITGELAPMVLHHNIASADWAVRECSSCHNRESRISDLLMLTTRAPAGIDPNLVATEDIEMAGRVMQSAGGGLLYEPSSASAGLYILGHDSWPLGDLLGLTAVLFALLGVALHGGLRIAYAVAQRSKGAEDAH